MVLRRKFKHAPIFGLVILGLGVNTVTARAAVQAGSPTAAARIVTAIDEGKLVPLAGQTSPLAAPRFDQGPVSDSFPMQHMFLQLRRSSESEAALERTIEELQDQGSGRYHQWLTAEELGTKFGPAQQDIDAVVRWLNVHEFQVHSVSRNGLTIAVSGTAGQVREAFHTEIHKYLVNGKEHIANLSDPQIPVALASVVVGFTALHDFTPKPAVQKRHGSFTFPCAGCPDGFDNLTQYDEAPADLATIYNAKPLYTAKKPITGKGQTVVVLERTDINAADVATFRSAFGLSKYSGKFTAIHPGDGCTDPGKNGDEFEAALDAEWAGAVAPDANVTLASCADTTTGFGPFIAAQNLLDLTTPPHIMSLSYQGCEAGEGVAFNEYTKGLWQQAASEGVSVFVDAGDRGAALCDDGDLPQPNPAEVGIAANGLGSTPYNTSTGGTDFLDTAEGTNSVYWSTSNTASGKSAKSYQPEMPWDDSCGSSILASYYRYTNVLEFCNSSIGLNFINIVATSGAPSFLYSKPSWQSGVTGMPNDGRRDLPDVSMFASNAFWNHAVLYCMSDASEGGAPCDYSNGTDTLYNSAGGTSFTAPQFASVQALINQKTGSPQGNAAPIYYKMAKSQYGSPAHPDEERLAACNSSRGNDAGKSCRFYDVTQGTSTVPCYGTNNCYGSTLSRYGLLSTSDSSLKQAYRATPGWDFATGLGTPNIANIVNHWP